MHFDKPTYTVKKTKKKGIPEGLYTKDPVTGEILFNKEIEDNQMVVPKSGHHFSIGARERLAQLFDPGTLVEGDAGVRSSDPLNFVDSQPYKDRLKRYERDSGLPEAVINATGEIHGIKVSVAAMDFRFCGGAMGTAQLRSAPSLCAPGPIVADVFHEPPPPNHFYIRQSWYESL